MRKSVRSRSRSVQTSSASRSSRKTSSSGALVVVSGPSGVGKTTVVRRMLAHPNVVEALSATTRPRRRGEHDGVDYYFHTPAQFERLRRRGEFAEWAVVYGNHYGTPKTPLMRAVRAGRVVVRNVDHQGWHALRGLPVPTVGVFLMPPSKSELRRRIRGRATDDPETIARRLREGEQEMAHRNEYHIRVVNDDPARCAARVLRALKRRGFLA